jgi:hypothetical protein
MKLIPSKIQYEIFNPSMHRSKNIYHAYDLVQSDERDANYKKCFQIEKSLIFHNLWLIFRIFSVS